MKQSPLMTRALTACAALALSAASTGLALAADFGSPAEAKAMLEKAIKAVQTDEKAALTAFSKGEAGFKDRDLYPFCGGPDGNFTAHPSLVGKSMKDLKDKAGEPLGAKFYSVAKEGEVSEVAYQWPRPGSDAPVAKVSFVTKVGQQICAVGYYK